MFPNISGARCCINKIIANEITGHDIGDAFVNTGYTNYMAYMLLWAHVYWHIINFLLYTSSATILPMQFNYLCLGTLRVGNFSLGLLVDPKSEQFFMYIIISRTYQLHHKVCKMLINIKIKGKSIIDLLNLAQNFT